LKIACLLKREAGTQVTLGEVEYNFQPNENDDHVAEVKDKAHIECFLNIPEGYCEHGKQPRKIVIEQKPVLVQPPVVDEDLDDDDLYGEEAALLGADWEPETVEYAEGLSIATAELVKQAFEASGYTVAEWNTQTEEDVQAAIEMRLAVLTPAPKTEQPLTDNTFVQEGVENLAEPVPATTPVLVQPQAPTKNQTKAEKKAALRAKKAELGQR
jgi:hypothetical protein